MIRIEPSENFVFQTIERAVKLAKFANPLGVFLLQQMLQSEYVEPKGGFLTYSYKADETKELIAEWVKSDPSAQSMLLKYALG